MLDEDGVAVMKRVEFVDATAAALEGEERDEVCGEGGQGKEPQGQLALY